MKNSTFLHRCTFFLVTLGGFAFSGCATKPPPQIDMSQLPKVAETVLSEAIYYNHIFSLCAKLGEEAEIEAHTKQQDWLAANLNLVMAADAVYSQHHANESFNYNSKPLLPEALRLKQKAYEKAEQELKLPTRTPNNQQQTCRFRFSKITPQNINLSQIPEVSTYAQALLTNAPASSNQLVDLPTLAAGMSTNIPPGKTHFQVKQQNEKECDDAHTLVLDNNWPNEAYANFCSNELIQVIICEWGNCHPK